MPDRRAISVLVLLMLTVSIGLAQYPATSQIVKDGTAVIIEDYIDLPISIPGPDGPTGDTAGLRYMLGRVNALVTEPADTPQAATRFFIVDQNGQLYILDRGTKKFTTYIDFSKVFAKFAATATYGGYSS